MTKHPTESFTIALRFFPYNKSYKPEWEFQVPNAHNEYPHSVVLCDKWQSFQLLVLNIC